MARITVEDCLTNEKNRFALVRLAARRAKHLLAGATPVANTRGNRAVVSALREIASGKVKFISKTSAVSDTAPIFGAAAQTVEKKEHLEVS